MADDRLTMQEQLAEVAKQLKDGVSEEDIQVTPREEPDDSLAKTEEAVAAAAEIPDPDAEEDEPVVEAAEEDAEVDESPEDESADDDEGNSLEAPAFWNKSQKEAWKTIPEEHKASAMEIFKSSEKIMSEKATELDATRKRVEVFDAVAKPYQAMLQAENATPETALQNYLQASYTLRNGTAVQKQQMIRSMATQFGVDIESALDNDLFTPESPQPGLTETDIGSIVDKRIQTHTAEVSVGQQITSFREQKNADGTLAHPHFDALEGAIAKGIHGGKTLEDAYTEAMSPFQEAVDAQVKSRTEAKTKGDKTKVIKAKKAAGTRLNGSKPPVANPDTKGETMVQTMQRVKAELSTEEARV